MTAPKWYDLTLSKEKGWTREKIIEIMSNKDVHYERFVVGDEIGEDGYTHLQMRVQFSNPHEEGYVRGLFPGAHTSPSHCHDFNYVEKEENFYRSWEGALAKYRGINLRYWQGQAVAMLREQDDRSIHVIVDPKGGAGKTTVSKYCQVLHFAQYVPPLAEAQDFMAFAMEKPSKAYIFDMPRCETLKQKKGMWSAVEQIKNGYVYDKRYSYRDMWIEPPAILVFSNEHPPTEYLSADRWHTYKIIDEGVSEQYLEEYHYDPREDDP